MKTHSKYFTALSVALASGALLLNIDKGWGQTNPSATTSQNTDDFKNVAPTQPNPASAQKPGGLRKTDFATTSLSSGLDEIIKMVKSDVETDVILNYIDNSLVAYYPSADEIVHLHEQGVPSKVITALIRHGSDRRAKMAQEFKENQNQPMQRGAPVIVPAPTRPAAPAYVPPPQVNYVYTYPQYIDADYPRYSYAAPYCYSYPYWGNYGASFNFWPHYRYAYPRHQFGVGFAFGPRHFQGRSHGSGHVGRSHGSGHVGGRSHR